MIHFAQLYDQGVFKKRSSALREGSYTFSHDRILWKDRTGIVKMIVYVQDREHRFSFSHDSWSYNLERSHSQNDRILYIWWIIDDRTLYQKSGRTFRKYDVKFLQVLKSMEDFFDDLGDMTDEIGSSENTRDSLLVDLQYIFIMAVCITGVPE